MELLRPCLRFLEYIFFFIFLFYEGGHLCSELFLLNRKNVYIVAFDVCLLKLIHQRIHYYENENYNKIYAKS